MKKICLILCLFAVASGVHAQLTLKECYDRARVNYPLVDRYKLIGQAENYDLANARKGWLPQFSVSAQATYQTQVTNIGAVFPRELLSSLGDVTLPVIPQDQYQVVGEVQQLIWDGGNIAAARQGIAAQAEVDRTRWEVDMYALRDRIDNLFFGILLIDEQLRLNEVYTSDLSVNYDRVAAYERNGVANGADLDAVRAEQVGADQRKVELESSRKAYVAMLAAFMGEPLPDDIELVKPIMEEPAPVRWPARPELDMYDALRKQAEAGLKRIQAGNMPRIGFFVQGAYGNPGLNMFRDKFTTYAIGGVRLSWNFGSLYTRRTDRLKIDNSIRNIAVDRDAFVFNLGLQDVQMRTDYEKYISLIEQDQQVIDMRRRIVRSSEAKLENGIISVADLMRDRNAQQNAELNKAVHEIEMLKSIYGLKTLVND